MHEQIGNVIYKRVDLSDADYAGTFTSFGHNGNKSGRERRGKVKCNKVRKPSWIHNETLEVLRATSKRHKVRHVNRNTLRKVVEVTAITQSKDLPAHKFLADE